ncbi:hypothetical protein FR483_n474L [Paramecium bursaria Chlorella virus FR483]|uniref:Uncharacterized protein n474L n=1 Tax=Paramecium bursaria Chlorella virus FR483 TaxID=399781 RepID=A7J7H8_PBCVF|nr:hypothetical protein FR483_n474L [Paramecium bursaria Chlorella virus FR483]ABT15759.1 hypothetical protein FR483_n474L [Paramecium bursaria Chlorella virus FR483]
MFLTVYDNPVLDVGEGRLLDGLNASLKELTTSRRGDNCELRKTQLAPVMLEQVIHDTIRTLRVNLDNILYRGVQFTPLGSITANCNLRVIKSKDAQNALVMATVDNIRVLPGVVNHVKV